MITKQKIKSLEKALSNFRGQKTFTILKKFDEEVYYGAAGEICYNLDIAVRNMDFREGDILVVVVDYGLNCRPKI
jgi:hypothetical protein